MYLYIYIYVCMYLYIYMYMYLYIYMYLSIYIYMYLSIYLYIYTCIYIYICIYLYIYMCVYMFIVSTIRVKCEGIQIESTLVRYVLLVKCKKLWTDFRLEGCPLHSTTPLALTCPPSRWPLSGMLPAMARCPE